MVSPYDIVIAGGGVVGCSAALSIVNVVNDARADNSLPPYKIAIVEAFANTGDSSKTDRSDVSATAPSHPSFDAKVVALAYQSYQQLKSFGIDIDAVDLCPIKHIHVSDKGHMGQSQLHTVQDKPALGFVVALEQLGSQLLKQVIAHQQIDYFAPQTIQKVQQTADNVSLELGNEEVLTTKLLLIAEGANSSTKQQLNIKNTVEDYAQTAIVTNIKTQLPHNNWAFERFTSQGPIAFLPMNGQNSNVMSVVWTLDNDKVDDVTSLAPTEFLSLLQSLFSDKLGTFQAYSTPVTYPLALNIAQTYLHHRTILLGNAAQSLHPIAGQGFNLGVRDIQSLVEVLVDANPSESLDYLGGYAQTHAYKRLREQDKTTVITATDSLVRLFSNHHLPLVVGRNLGLMALNASSMTKKGLTRFAMGER